MTTRDDKRMVKLDLFFLSKIDLFKHMLKISPIHFWCMVIPPSLHSIYTE